MKKGCGESKWTVLILILVFGLEHAVFLNVFGGDFLFNINN